MCFLLHAGVVAVSVSLGVPLPQSASGNAFLLARFFAAWQEGLSRPILEYRSLRIACPHPSTLAARRAALQLFVCAHTLERRYTLQLYDALDLPIAATLARLE